MTGNISPTGVSAFFARLGSGSLSPERKRLVNGIERARVEIPPLKGSDELLDKAMVAACTGDIDAGWRFLHQAHRLRFELYQGEELAIAAKVLDVEASAKLRGWRKDAVASLLVKPTGKALAEARRLFDEHNDNVYFRSRLVRTQMIPVSLALVFGLASFIYILGVDGKLPSLTGEITPRSAKVAMVLGLIAASMSALVTFSSASKEKRIPEHLANVWVAGARPLIGAVSGLVGLLALKANVVNLPAGNSIGWLIPFALGFSERLVFGVLNGGNLTWAPTTPPSDPSPQLARPFRTGRQREARLRRPQQGQSANLLDTAQDSALPTPSRPIAGVLPQEQELESVSDAKRGDG